MDRFSGIFHDQYKNKSLLLDCDNIHVVIQLIADTIITGNNY